MSFEKVVKLPMERIGVLIGKGGKVKAEIEKKCGVKLEVDSKTGEVVIKSTGDLAESSPLKAVDIVTAIARGFSPVKAFRLMDENTVLNIIDLKNYAGKSKSNLQRIKGRIIGLNGKARRVIEELTEANISVYGHMVAIIGDVDQVKSATDAVVMLATGSPHKVVYNMLQRLRTKAKMDRFKLWEEGSFV
ncbi:MAG: KH domain-containing protein [Nitrososphaerota archaeon]|nr:KH domain-containing protein [Nitrososphaerales archaeon]MCX8191373.1 KH domain-containing protein [Nitrososphaerales archaeon]MDW8044723.1 KH domain-containing protein [Nitrososphaerota archaeon]